MDQGKIFVGGLSWQTTEESLRWHFEQFGPVASVEVMKDRNTGQPRGFAFVVFADNATIDLVMKEGKHEINHKVVDVKRAQARGLAPPSIHPAQAAAAADNSSRSSSDNHYGPGGGGGGGKSEATPEQVGNKVFVGGIPPSVDRDGLKEILSEFGTVVDAIVMVDQMTQRSRCFGFCTFGEAGAAQRAIAAQPLSVQGRHVEIKLATPRAEQKRGPPGSAGGPMPGSSNAGGAPRHLGLRAGQASSSGEFAGLAVAYGRSGWKAGYGSRAFGPAGWAVEGWEGSGPSLERAGFSFDMLQLPAPSREEPPPKRSRH